MSGLILRLHRRDERALFYLVGRRRPWLDTAVRTFTHLGGVSVTLFVTAGMLVGGGAVREVGWLAAFALAVSHLAVQLLKRTISRPRPRLPVGIESLVEAPDRFSFPSGHAAAALSVALGLSILLPGVTGALVVLTGLLVGVSRCYLGVHYPGDVVAGWLLALSAFTIAAAIL